MAAVIRMSRSTRLGDGDTGPQETCDQRRDVLGLTRGDVRDVDRDGGLRSARDTPPRPISWYPPASYL
jgi:hypothetical protein